ncbi:hypothetical protein [Pseudoalteromonas sp.]|uniref:hypothetical protein n=1 Tax=Pseudoalteromonas sp. TaxID=53249 RepID=UPI0023541187|nr:hypothetical protein [Pseudoalteromonas sp.]
MVKIRRFLALSSLALVSNMGMVQATERGTVTYTPITNVSSHCWATHSYQMDDQSYLLFTNLVHALKGDSQDGGKYNNTIGSRSSWEFIFGLVKKADTFCSRCKIKFSADFNISIQDLHALAAAYMLLYIFIPAEIKLSVLFLKAVICGVACMFFNQYICKFMKVFVEFKKQSKVYNMHASVFPVLFIVYTIMMLSASNKVYWLLYVPTYLVFFTACLAASQYQTEDKII